MATPRMTLGMVGVGLMLAVWLWPDGNVTPAEREPPAAQQDEETPCPSLFKSDFALTGTLSCAGRACHGNLDPVPDKPVQQNEFTTWIGQDKHADAYRVLESDRSKKIQARLDGRLNDWQHTEPYKNVVCLNCHVFPGIQTAPRVAGLREEDVKADGVGCEACHGPAEKWLRTHTTPEWRNRLAKDKKKPKKDDGMWPIHTPLERAARCVTCHVGSSISDMNHDLIAAGHPRLNFEFTLFMANMPRHWKEETPEPNEAQAWAVGQLVTAEAALKLLAYRANPNAKSSDGSPKPWPEFAEYDCFSCHHDLHGAENWRQKRRPLGAFVWSNWYRTMPRSLTRLQNNPDLGTSLDQLAVTMQKPFPQGDSIARAANKAADLVKQWRDKGVGPVDLAALIADYRQFSTGEWDISAQLYLALAALDHPHADAIKRLAKPLTFRGEGKDQATYDSPKVYRKQMFDDLLGQLLK